jgi:aspartyl-tRNA(Asn)/glutamyl-tRNA(Gln) amidotransferase subunit C
MSPSSRHLDESAVRDVAHLARLAVSDAEVADYARTLSSILAYMDQLAEVNTDDVPPTAHPLPVRNVYRDDEPRPSVDTELALRNAPQQQANCFKVPKVLDQE